MKKSNIMLKEKVYKKNGFSSTALSRHVKNAHLSQKEFCKRLFL